MKNKKIVIVEDEAIVAQDLKKRLENMGFSVPVIASTFDEALDAVIRYKPDLIFLDIMLYGKKDGIEIAKVIKEKFDLSIIFLSAFSDKKTVDKAKVAEPAAYLLKPFKERELQITIELALYKYNMERKLKRQEQWSKTILQSIGDAVISTDKDSLIRFINPVAEQLTGWKQEDVLTQPINRVLKFFDENMKNMFQFKFDTVKQRENEVIRSEKLILINKSGSKVPIQVSISPIRDSKYYLTGIVIVFTDISFRKEIEKLRHEYIATISHDLKTPLTSINGALFLLKGTYSNDFPKDVRSLIDIAYRSGNNMLKLVKDIINVEQIESGELEFIFDKYELISGIEQIISESNMLEKQFNVSFIFLHQQEKLFVETDELRLKQVLTNLLSNAAKFSPDGGEIKISTIEKSNFIVISIHDDGGGIPDEYQDKVFNKFAQAENLEKRQEGGSGLGLSICKSIMNNLHGKIYFSSSKLDGTTFFIEVPIFETDNTLETK